MNRRFLFFTVFIVVIAGAVAFLALRDIPSPNTPISEPVSLSKPLP